MNEVNIALKDYTDETQKALRQYQQKEQRALYRAAAYGRSCIRRGIKKNKFNKRSQPGQPPYDHGHLRNSVVFAVDTLTKTSYVGPEYSPEKKHLFGELPPQLLEFGGRNYPGRNNFWFIKNPPRLTNETAVAIYFKNYGYAPIYMSDKRSEVARKCGKNEKLLSYIRYKFGSVKNPGGMYEQKKIYFVNLPVKGREKQAARGAKLVIKYFGLPIIKAGKVKPRPFVGIWTDKIFDHYMNLLKEN